VAFAKVAVACPLLGFDGFELPAENYSSEEKTKKEIGRNNSRRAN
jgi:hypothetical protein